MKVLLDENVPQKLRTHLRKHDTMTVAQMAWCGLGNGALLDAAESAGFDVFVTADRRLQFQQNIAGRKLAVLSLSTNNWPIIKQHVAVIAAAIDRARAGSFSRVECGTFWRKGYNPRGPGLA